MTNHGLLVVGLALGLLGCPGPDPVPGPDGRRSCAQLGWRCGVDDYGATCGFCGTGTTCNGNGVCATTGSCTPSCSGIVCGGSDGCRGRCIGSCPSGQTCDAGSLTCTTPITTPTTHDTASGRTPLFSNFYGVPFTVPAATTGYAVSSPTDTFNVGIFTAAEWTNYSAGGQGRAYIFRENIRTANEVGPMLPAGNYVLGFYCRNVIERCIVTYAVSSYY